MILYFFPDSKLGNGVAVFNPWFHAKKDPHFALFVSYLVNWVAGCKLIFIVLLTVILALGNQATKIGAVAVMILSIATYFWRLHPIIKALDNRGEVTPKGYSKTLFTMIIGFITLFSSALLVYFFL
ncbi:hypothetical protein RFF05_01885 [Bengtsoniella intestinalis]|uniref:hypothetical protein n=1 Tax=Bengtsoniella intestinalis TaxID=3073143 RepID=UPI00391F8FF8